MGIYNKEIFIVDTFIDIETHFKSNTLLYDSLYVLCNKYRFKKIVTVLSLCFGFVVHINVIK